MFGITSQTLSTFKMLVHTVFFWLKPDLSEEERQLFHNEVKSLGSIESVAGFYHGKPSATPPREVVDDTYDLGLTVILADLGAHDAYQADPIHLAFVEKCKPLWEKVKIYDAE